MKRCKNCSEEFEEALNREGLCDDCAEEADMAAEELQDEENDE
jgi:rRNA maturation endonuclease Nob1